MLRCGSSLASLLREDGPSESSSCRRRDAPGGPQPGCAPSAHFAVPSSLDADDAMREPDDVVRQNDCTSLAEEDVRRAPRRATRGA